MNEQVPPVMAPDSVALRETAAAEVGPRPVRSRRARWLVVIAVLMAAGYWVVQRAAVTPAPAAQPAAKRVPLVPVVAAAARQGDLPVYLTALGSVTAFNTVTVKSRVDGQLIKVAFQEGQMVHAGGLLAEIDPRPFQVQLAQAEGQLARDQAQLKDARLNLERSRELLARELIAKQLVDDQVAAVGQAEGATKVDQALIENAKLQLTYCRITAPISGRVGLRLVDVGNMVHANDQNGLVVITQVEPIAVVFTIPEDNLPPISRKLDAGARLPVEAYDRAGQTKLAAGTLLTADNQIDQSTGTVRLKAVFQNDDHALFPNQFVNVRLLLDVRAGAVTVPAAAIQRGPQGAFVYVVQSDHTVEVRPVTPGPTAGNTTAIDAGVSAGDIVVIDGVDKLRPGASVEVKMAEDASATAKRPGA
jgi:multidrug efflux system membrane fusion protein